MGMGGSGTNGSATVAASNGSATGGNGAAGAAGVAGAAGAAGNGGAGTGGAGGSGGSGGGNVADAGTFDMNNAMTAAAQSAAGISVMSQNSGAASFAQQAVTIQANLTVGR